jgi:pimeloyl-ACP methyl ester carboxylesterase
MAMRSSLDSSWAAVRTQDLISTSILVWVVDAGTVQWVSSPGGVSLSVSRVVLVHGTRDTAASFDGVRVLLPDLEVMTYTRRGWLPDAGLEPIDLDTHIDDLLAIIDETPSVVIGHSWGGNVVIPAAIRRPDLIASVGIWETSMLWLPGWPPEHPGILRRAIERSRQKLAESSNRQRERTRFIAEAESAFAQHFDLDDLKVPCVVGVGGASLPAFGAGMRQVAMVLDAEVFEIPDAGHMAHREHPSEFADFVRRAVSLAP